jgi:hypothetical protein
VLPVPVPADEPDEPDEPEEPEPPVPLRELEEPLPPPPEELLPEEPLAAPEEPEDPLLPAPPVPVPLREEPPAHSGVLRRLASLQLVLPEEPEAPPDDEPEDMPEPDEPDEPDEPPVCAMAGVARAPSKGRIRRNWLRMKNCLLWKREAEMPRLPLSATGVPWARTARPAGRRAHARGAMEE